MKQAIIMDWHITWLPSLLRRTVILIIAGGIILSEAGKNPTPVPAKTPGERDVLYQVSTIDALVMGVI